jgi:hypothetical protein
MRRHAAGDMAEPPAGRRLRPARAGVIVSLSSDGEPEVHRGLIRPEDAEAVSEAEEDADEERPSAPSLPATPIEALTARRTAARPRSTWGGHDCKGAGATTVILERASGGGPGTSRRHRCSVHQTSTIVWYIIPIVENIHIVTCPIRAVTTGDATPQPSTGLQRYLPGLH